MKKFPVLALALTGSLAWTASAQNTGTSAPMNSVQRQNYISTQSRAGTSVPRPPVPRRTVPLPPGARSGYNYYYGYPYYRGYYPANPNYPSYPNQPYYNPNTTRDTQDRRSQNTYERY